VKEKGKLKTNYIGENREGKKKIKVIKGKSRGEKCILWRRPKRPEESSPLSSAPPRYPPITIIDPTTNSTLFVEDPQFAACKASVIHCNFKQVTAH
jgi:hypothetical protein